MSSPSLPLRSLLAASLLTLSALAPTACGQQGIIPTTASSGPSGSGGAAAEAGTGAGAGGGSGGGAPVGDPITIVDWNTHNFFDTTGTIGDDALSGTDYPKKRKSVGATIKSLNPDIAVLAEIETKVVLDDLNTNELNGEYMTWLTDTKDVREIGVLSRVPIDMVVSHASDVFVENGTPGPNYTYTRDCVEVHLTFHNRKIILLGVHFRSKVAPDNPDKRLAEAQHTRAIADDLAAKDPTAAIVVLGDYNDTPGSPPYAAVQGAAPTLFTDAADQVAEADRYSFTFQGMKELIDHQMGNAIMAAGLDKASVFLKHGAGVDDGSQYGSDHAPLKAIYRF